MQRNSLYFVAPENVELRKEELGAPQAGEVQIQAACSAVSAGTELMVYRGEAPAELAADETLPALSGSLAYPLKFGYSMVGRVSALGEGVDPSWMGKRVFAFNPHETAFNSAAVDLQPVPENITDEDAVFLPNVETALNLILDGNPRLGEKVVVLGQGIVGLMATESLARHPLGALLTFDRYALRREHSLKSGAERSFDPMARNEAALRLLGAGQADLVYELSGHPEALDLALSLVGDNGRIVVGSWYGKRRATIDLGGRFHRGRVKIISSQVSHIEPALTGRWDRARRFEVAWKLLGEIRPSGLVTHRFDFNQAGAAYTQLGQKPAETLGVLFKY